MQSLINGAKERMIIDVAILLLMVSEVYETVFMAFW